MSASGRMGRNPFGTPKAAAVEKPQTPSPAPTIPEKLEEEFVEERPGLFEQIFVKTAVELPADIFVLGVKARAFVESFLNQKNPRT